MAVLAPVASSSRASGDALAELEKGGVVRRGRVKLSAGFFSATLPRPADGSSVVEALLQEREGTR
jgi:hypothetical protein